MSKKDYELIARVIAAMPRYTRPIQEIAREFAVALATTNPRFDRARFMAACGVEA